jgi:hypothetical protein
MITELLRHPDDVIVRCRDTETDRDVARFALLAIIVGGAAFGAALGSYRGGFVMLHSTWKIPLATLLTLAVCGPGFASFAAVFDRRWSFRETTSIGLAAGARSSLVLFALSPALWLAIDLGVAYETARMLATLAYGLAGLSGLGFWLRALGPALGRPALAFSFISLFLLVGAQAAWVLRPFLGDPRDTDVPLFAQGREEGGVPGAFGLDFWGPLVRSQRRDP